MNELPMGSRPTSERQARELTPLLNRPDELRNAWQEARERSGRTWVRSR